MTPTTTPAAETKLSPEGHRRAIQQLERIQREKEGWANRLGQPGCAARLAAQDDAEALSWAIRELSPQPAPALSVDLEELKRLAERAIAENVEGEDEWYEASRLESYMGYDRDFIAAASPAAILSLIAHIEPIGGAKS